MPQHVGEAPLTFVSIKTVHLGCVMNGVLWHKICLEWTSLNTFFELYYILFPELFYCDGFQFFLKLFSEFFGIKGSLHFYAILMLCALLSQTDVSHSFTLYIFEINFWYYPLIHT